MEIVEEIIGDITFYCGFNVNRDVHQDIAAVDKLYRAVI